MDDNLAGQNKSYLLTLTIAGKPRGMVLHLDPASQRRFLTSFPFVLALGVLAVDLFVIVMAGSSLRYSRHQYRLQAETTARNLCQVLEQNLVGTINQINLALLAVKGEAEREIAGNGIHREALDAFIAQQSGYVPAIYDLRITNAQGEGVYGTGLDPDIKVSLADRDYFRRLRDDPHAELVTSAPLVGRYTGKWAIIVARRINRPDGSFGGITLATVTLEHLTQALTLVDTGKHGLVVLRSTDLSLLARYPVSAVNNVQLGQKVVTRQFRELFDSGRSEGIYTTLSSLDPVERTFSFRRISGYPFIVVVALATQDYLTEWQHEAARMWGLVGLFLLFTLLAWGQIYYSWERQFAAIEALANSGRFLRAVIDLVPHFIFAKDRESRYLLVNRACAEACGATPDQMIGRSTREFAADPMQAEQFMQADRQVLDSGTAQFIAEEDFRLPSGQTQIHQTVKVPFVNSSTGQAALIGVAVDVTDQKRAQHALAEGEDRLRTIVELAPDGILVFSEPGQILAVNKAACNQLGYTRDQLLQLSVFDIVSPQFAERVADRLQEGFPAGTYESLHVRADGVEIPVELSVTKIMLHGQPAFLGLARDITRRKQAEQAVRESEAELAAAQRIARIGSCQWDIRKNQARWSEETCRIFGFDRGQLEKPLDSFLDRVHPADRQRVQQALADALNGTTDYDIEYRIVLPDGSERVIQAQAEVLLDKDGKPVTLRGTVHDVTERKRAEEEKAELRNQLLLSQKMETVGRLAGGVAHDFNNLLTVISGYSELLLDKLKEGDPLREQAAEIHRAGAQGAALTRQLLAFSRAQVLEMKPLNLNRLINESQVMLEQLLGEDIQMETLLDPALGLVMADPVQLHQVLLNLAANSHDAMPHGGRFIIKTTNLDTREAGAATILGSKPGPFILLQVSDTGTGIAKEIQERIFDPFFTTKEHGKGTGLGLATVYGIVRQSGCAISVHSEPGQGAAFQIYLPQAEIQAIDAPGETKSPELLHGTETVLVVEDRLEVRRLAVDALQASGYQILEAADGKKALQVVERHGGAIHLLLTDVIMPHMTGKELAERLKGLCPEIKVLYMSGYAADVISSRGLLSSSEQYIAKPFSLESLLVKVREVLGPAALNPVR
jgi:PAS domain S-box-containing protein